ncbi:MAG: hypothetical protein JNL08_09415 [Planctomycetes bacterium]|nr:hypothetical protein [Planctomycetota bacterium]
MRSLDISLAERSSRTAAEWLWPLLPIGVSVFSLSALIYYHVKLEVVEVRSALQVVIAGIYQAVGLAPAVMFFLLTLTWSSIWFVTGKLDRPVLRIGRLLAMTVMLGVFLNLGDGGVAAASHKGELGAWLAGCLVAAFGYLPSLVLVWAVTFASLLLATDFFFSDSFERLRHRPSAESGVEPAVTEHLRGLGALSQAAPTAPMAPPVELGPLEELAPLPPLVVEPQVAAAAATAPTAAAEADEADEAAYEPRRRRSYFERRRDEEAAPEPMPAADLDRPSDDDLGVARTAEWGPVDVATEVAALSLPATPGFDRADTEEGIAAEELERAIAADRTAELPEPTFVPLDVDTEPLPADRWRDTGASAAVPSFGDNPAAAAMGAPEADDLDDTDDLDERDGTQPTELAAAEPAEAAEAAEDDDAEDDDADAADAPVDDEVAAEDTDEPAAPEAVVAIPRPDPAVRERAPARQQQLFANEVDDDLVQEAMDVLDGQSRATASLLQRRLRIDYDQAVALMAQLGARGLVELEADATQGRVIV